MRKITGIVVGFIGLVATLLLAELLIPAADGITSGFLGMLWVPFKAWFLDDMVKSIALFVLLCGITGTWILSKREENKRWAIVSGIISAASGITMLARK